MRRSPQIRVVKRSIGFAIENNKSDEQLGLGKWMFRYLPSFKPKALAVES